MHGLELPALAALSWSPWQALLVCSPAAGLQWEPAVREGFEPTPD